MLVPFPVILESVFVFIPEGEDGATSDHQAAASEIHHVLRRTSATVETVGDAGARFGERAKERVSALPTLDKEPSSDTDKNKTDDSSLHVFSWAGWKAGFVG